MTIRIITSKTADRALDWYARAFNTPEVARFMQVGHNQETPSDFHGDWSNLTLMDDEGHGLVRLAPDRGQSCFSCDISCWVLPTAPCKRRTAGELLGIAFNTAANRFGSKYVDWNVHGSNEESLRFSNKRAVLVGIRKEGAWDRELGGWVDLHEFRKDISEYRYENQLRRSS